MQVTTPTKDTPTKEQARFLRNKQGKKAGRNILKDKKLKQISKNIRSISNKKAPLKRSAKSECIKEIN